MTDWQPIDTAPTDGTQIDLWMVDQDGRGWREPDAWYVRNERYDHNVFSEDGSYRMAHDKRDGWYAPNHDYDNSPGWCDRPKIYNPHPNQRREIWTLPTHWMPLPEPPTETNKDDK